MAKDLEKKAKMLEEKIEKAEDKKEELADKIEELRIQILEEKDEKAKNALRAERQELIDFRNAIINSKDGATIPMAKKTKTAIKAVIAVVIVIAILVTYVATGAVRKGPVAGLGLPQTSLTGMTITDKDGNKHGVKVATYNYYFAMQYNNLRSTQQMYEQYGITLTDEINVDFDKAFSDQNTKDHDGNVITWAEYMEEEVFESILSTYTYYYEAVKANDGKEPEITEKQQTELDDTLNDYKEAGEKYGMTTSAYLTAAMGKGVTEKLFRQEAKIAYIAQNYQDSLKKDLEKKEYKKADYDKYLKENKKDLETVDAKIFEAKSSNIAKKFMAELKADGSNFAELASKYADGDWDKEANKNPVETSYKDVNRELLQKLGYAVGTADDKEGEKYSGLDWVFSSKRKAGDAKQFDTSCVYITKAVNVSKTPTVTVRHILVTPYFDVEEKEDDADAKKATKKQWNAAKKQAEKIVKEYNKGKKTAKAFGELAKKYTEDSNGDEGGIYENVVPNQMVRTFDAWCFDASRKAGDVEIVKTEFGYHIIYFEKKGDMPVWKYNAQQSLASDENSKNSEDLEKAYSIDKNWFGSRYFEKDTDIDN